MDSASPILLPLANILVGTVIIRAVGSITNGLKFDDWGSACGAVVIAHLVGWGGGYLLQGLVALGPGDAMSYSSFLLRSGLIGFVVNLVGLGTASLFISGMHVQGVVGFVLSVLALTAVETGISYLPVII